MGKRQKGINIVRVSAARMRAMQVGDTCVFSEPASCGKSAGAACQSYASRLGISIKTSSCLVITPNEPEMVKAVLVTRIT